MDFSDLLCCKAQMYVVNKKDRTSKSNPVFTTDLMIYRLRPPTDIDPYPPMIV